MAKRGVGVAVALVIAIAAAGCTVNSNGKAVSTTAKPKPGATTTTIPGTGIGVTGNTIKLGVAMINFACIPKSFVDEERPKQQAANQAYIDDINNRGGISGRTITPVFKTVCPLADTDGQAACTSFADDSQVFAVIGEFGQITPNIPLCVTKQHNRPLITYGLTQDMVDQAPPGMLLTPDIL